MIQEHQPVFHSVDHEILRAAYSAVESGIEYAIEVLAVHDANLGRERARHKREAHMIENDIERMKSSRDRLRKSLGWEVQT